MSIYLYSAFVLACIVLAITPGPNMALFIANATSHGTRAALLTVFGSVLGLSILVAAATLGMSSIMAFVADWFEIIRWVGVAYLVWLGVTRLRAAWESRGEIEIPVLPGGPRRWVSHGLVVSLSNPKVLLFLGAFFPQFIDPTAAIAPQLALLAVTFVAVITAVDTMLVCVVGSARSWLMGRRRHLAEGFSGILLICGALWLATTRRA